MHSTDPKPRLRRLSMGVAPWWWSALSVAALSLPAASQGTPEDQFGPENDPLYGLDQVTGDWVNLETQLVEPLLFLEGRDLLAVCNEPDQRVEFFDEELVPVDSVMVGQGPASLAENPGADELWVSVRHQMSVVVIDLSVPGDYRVSHVLRPPVLSTEVGGIEAAAPGGIAFLGGKAYVASSYADSVQIYDATTKLWERTVPLSMQHHGAPALMNDPFGVVAKDGKVFVTSLLSGNNTAALNKDDLQLLNPDGTVAAGFDALGPEEVQIRDLSTDLDRSLPDVDIAALIPGAPGTAPLVRPIKRVGTVLLGIAADTMANRLVVSNLDAHNDEHIGENSFPDGKVMTNRLSFVDLNTGAVSSLETEFLGAADEHVVMPTDIEMIGSGTFFVAGYCSANIGVWDTNLNFRGIIDTDAGPRGLSHSATHELLYCYNRAAGTITAFDISGALPSLPQYSVELFDPTWDLVKEGRMEFLLPNSGDGTNNCASCHVDGRMDGLGWNLSKTIQGDPGPTGTALDFIDHKGVMVTQDLRGTGGNAPYHWRGEQRDLEDFDGAFEELLHGQPILEMSPERFAALKAFVFSLEFPPNPEQPMNRHYSAPAEIGHGEYIGGTCDRCHALPQGTLSDLTDSIKGHVTGDVMEATALRGMWTKRSDMVQILDGGPVELHPATGFGILHEGLMNDLEEFMVFLNPPNQDEIEAFVRELDTGLAPASSYSEILNADTAGTARAQRIRNFLQLQAVYGNIDLSARGRVRVGGTWTELGLYLDRSGPSLLGSDGNSYTFAALEAGAAAGDVELLFVGAPRGSGRRLGIDRDRDGLLDHAGEGDPLDPDVDGDGVWDGTSPNGAHPVLVDGPHHVFSNSNNIKISWETDLPSPTILRFREALSSDWWEVGDQALAAGSNEWKYRHTVFIRPNARPLSGQTEPLELLRPGTNYDYEIVTISQEGVQSPPGTTVGVAATLSNLNGIPTFRGSEMELIAETQNPDGTWTFRVRVRFEMTQGAGPVTDGLESPGFFVHHDESTGSFTRQQFIELTSQEEVIFEWANVPGVELDDRMTFTMPMSMPRDPALPTGARVIFTTGGGSFRGQWSDSETFIEWRVGSGP